MLRGCFFVFFISLSLLTNAFSDAATQDSKKSRLDEQKGCFFDHECWHECAENFLQGLLAQRIKWGLSH